MVFIQARGQCGGVLIVNKLSKAHCNTMPPLRPRHHTTWLCLILMVIAGFLSSLCAAKHHHHRGSQRGWREEEDGKGSAGREGEYSGKRSGRGGEASANDEDYLLPRSAKLTSYDNRRNVLLHEAVRKLLGFGSSPANRRHSGGRQDTPLLPNPHRPPPMPQYVLDLYEKYRSGEMMERPNLGNTIRSIPAEIGEVNGEAMFVFNLSSIATAEQVLRAHVHLYKRKHSHRKRRSRMREDTEMVLYEVAPHYLSQTGTIIMRSSAHGWQWYGATDAVLSCLLVDRQHPHLFALTFRAEKPSGKVRPLALKKFVRHHSLPFLILYSNETESVNLEELDIVAERLKETKSSDSLSASRDNVNVNEEEAESGNNAGWGRGRSGVEVPEEDQGRRKKVAADREEIDDAVDEKLLTDLFRGFGHKHHQKSPRQLKRDRTKSHAKNSKRNNSSQPLTGSDSESHPVDSSGMSLTLLPRQTKDKRTSKRKRPLSSVHRDKRSIFTNEIPEDPGDYSKFSVQYNLPLTHPSMLVPRNELRHRLEPSRIIPYPTERSKTQVQSQRKRKKHRRRKNRRRNRKNRKRILPAGQWKDYADNAATPENNPAQVCSRRRLVVDFADIGWGDWIISPKSFEAHFCAGTCPFPLTKMTAAALPWSSRRHPLWLTRRQTWVSTTAGNARVVSQYIGKPFALHHISRAFHRRMIPDRCFKAHARSLCAVKVLKCVQKLRPSNHATIQSIINAVGLYSNVPAPCCVPDAMTSVTLLYFDENRNVVLKNYPGMSVTSCACR